MKKLSLNARRVLTQERNYQQEELYGSNYEDAYPEWWGIAYDLLVDLELPERDADGTWLDGEFQDDAEGEL